MVKGKVLFLDKSDLKVNAKSAYEIKGGYQPMFEADMIIFENRVIKNRYGKSGKIVDDDHTGDETDVETLKEAIDILLSDGKIIERNFL